MAKLSELPNIGKVVEEQLIQVGINTPEQLRAAGSKEAWLKIFEIDPSACINRLYGVEGAVQGISKKLLPDDKKQELKAFFREAKGLDK